MHNFLLRNLDDHTLNYFKQQVHKQGRSLQAQFHLALSQLALSSSMPASFQEPFKLAEQIRTRLRQKGPMPSDSTQALHRTIRQSPFKQSCMSLQDIPPL